MWNVIGRVAALILVSFVLWLISSWFRKLWRGRQEWTKEEQLIPATIAAIRLLQTYMRIGDDGHVRGLFHPDALEDLDWMDDSELHDFPGANFTAQSEYWVDFSKDGLNVMVTSEPYPPDGRQITASLTFPYSELGKQISRVTLVPEAHSKS